jgi:hypothetical protein
MKDKVHIFTLAGKLFQSEKTASATKQLPLIIKQMWMCGLNKWYERWCIL